jgi:hypothetical protein
MPEAHDYLEQMVKGGELIGHSNPWQRYLLDNGQEYTSAELDPAVYDSLMEPEFRRRNRRHHCFRNAQRLALDSAFEYVEGVTFVANLPIPITHGWNTHDGVVIDMTMRYKHKGKYLPVLGEVPNDTLYYGMVIDKATVRRCVTSHDLYMSVLDDWVCRFPLVNGTEHRDDVKGIS